MKNKWKKFIPFLFIFYLVTLSGNLTAQERRGANLELIQNDGRQVKGELIAVKKDSLLLLDSETEADLSVNIKDIQKITVRKKSRIIEGGLAGFLAGATLRGLLHSTLERTQKEEEATAHQVQKLLVWGAIGAAIGGAGGTALGMDKTITMEGKSDAEIQETLEKLNKKAREPNFQ